ncbi:isopeptide-forming domain-containing fimbrial protein [Enterococcus gallinarum]|nr:isopeptide-forming domain-containing fimbrial protein [Enterococcus gallinarum]MBO6422993.1 isopeptide-forming domain-containing fimbrial protein [Enterococcus gallinarum]
MLIIFKREGLKMKKIKFLLILMVLFIISFAVNSATVFAGEKGSITINDTTTDKIYDIYKIFDLTHSSSDKTDSVAYSIDPDWTDFFEGAGAEFIVDINNSGSSLNTIVVSGKSKFINITDENIADFSKKALKYAATKRPDSSERAVGETVIFDNLELGYYLVYPEGATEVMDGFASICSLTSTVPNGIVNIKASYPTLEKKVNDETVDIGQIVTYTITGKVPDTTGYDSYQYKVSDTMSAGLTFNSNVANFSVTIGGAVIDVPPVYTGNGFTLTLDMTDYQDKIGKDVIINYSAVVNKNAVLGSLGNPNSATLTYSNDPKDTTTTTTPPVEVKVYTAEINIFKFAKNATDKIPLENAEFILMDENGKYYKFTSATENNLEKVEWVSDKNEASRIKSVANGSACFKGLESGKYKIEEVVAPDGYNLLTAPVEVNINHEDFEGTNPSILEVENKAGGILPETGGVGTKSFYILGGLLMTFAVILLIAKNKFFERKN